MKKILSLLLILALSLSLCACGEARSDYRGSSSAGRYDDSAYSYAYAATEEAWPAEPAPMPDAAVYGLSANQAAGGETAKPSQRPGKIIYSANVQVETTDFDGTLASLSALIEDYEGWVESSSVNGSNYSDRSRGNVSRRSANYTLRIPCERFDELMNSLSSLGNIPYTHVYTENVTAQYYDVQARLVAYSAQEQRLLEMMELAETVEDVIILEDRLTQVRYQIESLQSTLNNWDRQVSYSTVYLDITEVQEYSPEPQVQPSFGQQLKSALQEGFHGMVVFLQGLLLGITASLPALLFLAAVVILVVVLVKKARKKKKAAREQARRAAAGIPAPEAKENPEKP